jgi:chromosome segregation ATPase
MYRLIASVVLLLGLLGTIWAEHVEIKSLKADKLTLANQVKSVQIDLDNCNQKFNSLSLDVTAQNSAVAQLSTDKQVLENQVQQSNLAIGKLRANNNIVVQGILSQKVDNNCDKSLTWLVSESVKILKGVP